MESEVWGDALRKRPRASPAARRISAAALSSVHEHPPLSHRRTSGARRLGTCTSERLKTDICVSRVLPLRKQRLRFLPPTAHSRRLSFPRRLSRTCWPRTPASWRSSPLPFSARTAQQPEPSLLTGAQSAHLGRLRPKHETPRLPVPQRLVYSNPLRLGRLPKTRLDTGKKAQMEAQLETQVELLRDKVPRLAQVPQKNVPF